MRPLGRRRRDARLDCSEGKHSDSFFFPWLGLYVSERVEPLLKQIGECLIHIRVFPTTVPLEIFITDLRTSPRRIRFCRWQKGGARADQSSENGCAALACLQICSSTRIQNIGVLVGGKLSGIPIFRRRTEAKLVAEALSDVLRTNRLTDAGFFHFAVRTPWWSKAALAERALQLAHPAVATRLGGSRGGTPSGPAAERSLAKLRAPELHARGLVLRGN